MAADDLFLSPGFGRDNCHVGAYIYWGRYAEPYLKKSEQLLLSMEGRPHWGKEFSCDSNTLRNLLPGLGTFNKIRTELDPNGTFSNDYIRRVLG